MQRHLIDAGNPLFNEFEAIVIGKAGRIFFDHKQMQPVALAGRLFYQPAVAEGEGIGIHHDSADFFFPADGTSPAVGSNESAVRGYFPLARRGRPPRAIGQKPAPENNAALQGLVNKNSSLRPSS